VTIDLETLRIPVLQSMADKSVPKVMDARSGVATARAPLELRSQYLEGPPNGMTGRRSTVIEDKECVRSFREGVPIALSRIAGQRGRRRRVQRYPSRLMIFALAHQQAICVKLDIGSL
jgi:hypothetical protein